MPWRSPSRLRSEPGAAARQAPFAGGRLLTVMMLRGYYRPQPADGDSLRISLAGPPLDDRNTAANLDPALAQPGH